MKKSLFNSARRFALGLALAAGASAAAVAQDHTGHTGHQGQGQTGQMPYDLHYIDMTLMHHEQGVEMARLAQEKGQSAKVKAFAQKTAADQERDTKELQRYRDTWYAGRPAMDHAQMMSHMQSMPGHGGMRMDHGADMEKLRAASGAAFDRLFLETMIHHHQMAIDMSKDATTKAEHAELKTFARRVVTKQQAEVAEMNRLKAGVGGTTARKAAAKPAAKRAAKPAAKRKRPAPKSTNHSGHSGHNMH
jgi:uncharacterized protein (DUF305 family)